MGRDDGERRTEGRYNGVCVQPQSRGSVWTQRQQKEHLLWATGKVGEGDFNTEESKECY